MVKLGHHVWPWLGLLDHVWKWFTMVNHTQGMVNHGHGSPCCPCLSILIIVVNALTMVDYGWNFLKMVEQGGLWLNFMTMFDHGWSCLTIIELIQPWLTMVNIWLTMAKHGRLGCYNLLIDGRGQPSLTMMLMLTMVGHIDHANNGWPWLIIVNHVDEV